MYSFFALSSPLETMLTTGETAWNIAPEKSAEPWCGTLKISDLRLRRPALCSRVRKRLASSFRSPVKR